MTRRARKGEGSVYQRSSDGKWCAAVTLPDGRRKVVYGVDEKDALKQRRALLNSVDAGRPLPAGRTPTLGQFLERWLTVTIPSEVEAGHLTASTADSYDQKIRLHVLPTPIAETRINALTTEDVREWQLKKLRSKSARGKPMSPRTVGYTHAIVRRALNDALRDEKLARNVFALVPLPAGQATPAEDFDETDLQLVFAEAIEDKHRVLWLTILALGLRKGETLGLRWSRLDLDAGTARIAKQIYRERGEADATTGKRSTRLVEADTKTKGSKATMIIPTSLVPVLRDHRLSQRRARLAARVWADPDLVFTTSVGTALEPRNVNRSWDAVCARAAERAGHPIHLRVHDIRHASASLAFADGATVKQVQEMLRHTREATTSNIYVHLLESVRKGTAATMDGVLRRVGGL
jgi:integrase